MKISLNWLREYVDFPGDAAALAELLTMSGVEVEGIIQRGVAIEKVVVAQVLASDQHPNADRLSVCRVDDGSGTPRQIVCGAKNYKVGDKVPLAQPGAVLPGDFKIKVGKLRGVESEGMMCSAKELGIAEDAEGLLILSPEAQVGAPLAELFPADTVLDLEITPNRPDLLSHLGIAREVAALTGVQTHCKRVRKAELNFSHGVENEAESCPFYTARHIANVKVGPSPAWLRQRLEAVGLRAINNIVDVTNYVMLERGQPLHAFDASKLDGDLRVRCGSGGEPFLALDGRTYALGENHMVIADRSRAVAIAGVMGGEGSGVGGSTTDIWLESAYFLPSSVRATSRGLGLMSDSSYRFEREVDPAGVLVASQRAAELIAEIAGGEPGELRIGFAANSQFGFDAEGATEGTEFTNTVALRPERCAALLGMEVQDEEINEILTGFGLRKGEGGWQIPSFRSDLTREVDLIEEVARVIGIEEIPGRQGARFSPSSAADGVHDRAMDLRRALRGLGLHEARTLTLVAERALKHHFGATEARRVRNPLSEDQVVLRPSLVPGLIDALGRNARAGEKAVRLFEIGRAFSASGAEERPHLAVLLSGPAQPGTWRGGDVRDADLFDLKGILTTALGREVQFRSAENPALGLAASVECGGAAIGHAGQLWPHEARGLDANSPVVFAEIDLTAWFGVHVKPARFGGISRYPAVTRDIALIAPLATPHERIDAALRSANEPLLAAVELFDLFTDATGEKVPVDKKSLAYSLTYRSPERTLTADEVNAAHARLKERLKGELGVLLRE